MMYNNLTKMFMWCNGHMVITYKTIETLPGGWKSYAINFDNNADPNEPWVSVNLGGI